MATKPHYGAALYVPATHKDLRAIAAGQKLADARNLIFCLEDSVADHDLNGAYANLAAALREINRPAGASRFIRPRSPESLLMLLSMPGIEGIDGFVLPKFSAANAEAYLGPLSASRFVVMPTLETIDVFEEHAMRSLCQSLRLTQRTPIAAIRIGGNDLLSLIGMRRPRGMTIYDTPIGDVISSLVRVFKPKGFQLTAPVFEYFDDEHTLAQELRRDLAHGLCGKTAIHPCQIDIIERSYRVSEEDVSVARKMLDQKSAGVFKMNGAMCEPATHSSWAVEILARSPRKDF